MQQENLFSNLKTALELLTALMPSIDSKLLVLFAGIILGYLEMHGYASPTDHTQNLDALTEVLGAGITITTIASYYIHDAVTKKNKLKYGGPGGSPIVSQIMPSQPILERIKHFVLRDVTVNPPATQPLPTPQPVTVNVNPTPEINGTGGGGVSNG